MTRASQDAPRRPARDGAGGLGPVDWLSLAAAPTFAIMALLSEAEGGGPLEELCATGPAWAPLSGMTMMYALMSAFHMPPWLRLIAKRRPGSCPHEGDRRG